LKSNVVFLIFAWWLKESEPWLNYIDVDSNVNPLPLLQFGFDRSKNSRA
jgi:hypothetical protein